jgi:hypothetical protein
MYSTAVSRFISGLDLEPHPFLLPITKWHGLSMNEVAFDLSRSGPAIEIKA